MAGEEATHKPANQDTHIAEMLFANPLNLNELGYNKYPVLPLKHLPAPRVAQLESGNVLLATISTEFEGYHAIKDARVRALQLPHNGEQVPYLSAPILVSLIVSLNYRKIAPTEPDSSILQILGEHGSVAWLKVAIQAFGTTGQDPFLVTRDNSVNSPTIELSDVIWAVKATMPPPHRYLAVVHRKLPILRAAPVFGNHLVSESESPDEALQLLDGRLSCDTGDAVYTVALTITREQALVRVGELFRQLRDATVDRKSFKPQMELLMDFYTFSVLPRDIKMRFEAVLAQDITETYWEHQLPGERIEMQDSDLTGPSMKLLGALVNSLPKKDTTKLERARCIQAWKDVGTLIDYQQRFRDDWTKFAEILLQNRSPNTSPISDGALEKLNGTLEKL
ncbi:hypothetical protein FVER53590_05860 [Fusarium verticillioides]|nr:hypothetical protein FVER53590_05860 [Fusarium verticillioides]